MRITDDYVFFYKDWLSNYQRTNFEYKDHDFTSTEQAFMYMKAMFFQDYESAINILDSKTPNEARLLGRKVKGYDDKKWSEVRYKIFYELNLIKYTTDKKLQRMLLDQKFDGKVFVEASPIDKIWGVGYDEYQAEYNEFQWGRNYLGKIITNIRNRIKQNKLDDPNWYIYDYWGKNDETDK